MLNRKTQLTASADIWEDVRADYGYVVSIDPGKAKTSESVAHVWRFADGYTQTDGKIVPPIFKHCATLAGFYDEWEMAEYSMSLARYYNNAVICPEDNLDIVSHLKEYPDLYYREDPRDNRVGRSVGWQTNVSTKPYMVTELNKHLEELECYDQRFWEQLRNIRRDAKSKSGLNVVGAEDHHMAGGIAIVCRTAMPVARGYIGSAGWAEDWGKN
jgi:hypothetical protein